MPSAKGLRPYALALLDAASGAGELAAVSEAFSYFLECEERVPNIVRYLQWPGASLEKRERLILVLIGEGGAAGRLVSGLLRALLRRGRIRDAGKVFDAFVELKDAREGTAEVLVESAWALDSGGLEAANAIIGREFYPAEKGGKHPSLRYKKVVVPELIGGLRLRIGDRQFDDSLRARLDRLARSL
jgi:F-type H+-transporting ATPase subunit delta